ncbi:YggT family protein [Paenibacillus spiritus]|uniref:YggT family protein n=1 Tax=Paenibacillus spiritus TaxID=2496557 RepID=A0A5J5GHV1_9BACL|nr:MULTISPECIES: YggT family protein [Paenibacillus]KAA9007590.1 YggT family protein [Paenibacillus spiritus]
MSQVLDIINILYGIYMWMIIFYVLMSWFPAISNSFVGELLAKLVEPYLAPFRRVIPPLFGTMDFSPIIAFFVLRYAVMGLQAIIIYLFG